MTLPRHKIIDLHSHTTLSDGTYTPTELIDYAHQKQLSALAITDHDTVAALSVAKEYATKYSELEIISGIEFSTHSDICTSDIHILGYYIQESDPIFLNQLNTLIQSRESRNTKMLQKLNQGGFALTIDDVRSMSDDGVITRSHFAQAMVALGMVKNMSVAFNKYIGNGCPYSVNQEKFTPQMAIQMILSNGGVPVLAHPVLYKLNLKALDLLLSQLKSFGLLGIEGIYTTYRKHETQYIKQLADQHHLLITGGSDFHGANKPGIDLGVGFGNLVIPYSIRDALYQLVRQ